MGRATSTADPESGVQLQEAIRRYWQEHIHDLELTTCAVGTAGFFQELDEYRYDKLHYLPRLVDPSAFRGKRLLEVGCGLGIDLVRFARAGAEVTGVDLSDVSIELARANLEHNGLVADLHIMDGEYLQFAENTFDVVYAHGVLPYVANPQRMVDEAHRVLRPGGQAILMVYNRRSWLSALSKIVSVELEHRDAPVYRTLSTGEFTGLLKAFQDVHIICERFPVRTRLHHGLKAALYNEVFVRAFQMLPRPLVRPIGWHIMAFCEKAE